MRPFWFWVMGASAVLLSSGASADPQPATEYGQIRQDLLDIVSKELADSKQVTFRVRWQYLPKFDSEGKIYIPLGPGASGHEFKLPNSVFSAKGGWDAWSAKNSATAKKLSQAIGGSDTLGDALGALGTGDSLEKWFITRDRTSSDIFRAWRDASAVHFLLEPLVRKGHPKYGGVILDVDPSPRGGERRIITKGVWTIRVKEADKELRHFEAEFLSDPVTLTFRKGLTGKAKITALSGIIEEDSKGAYINAESSLRFVGEANAVSPISPPATDKAARSEPTSSVGSYVLDLVAGGGYRGLLAPLIDNDSEASIFQGALLFGGKPVPLYGLNFLLKESSSASLGFMYGLIGKADETLYLGPSVGLGPITLTLGGRFGTTDNNRSDIRLSGGISVDLTKLLGKKDTSTVIQGFREDKTPLSVWPPLDRSLRVNLVSISPQLKQKMERNGPIIFNLAEGDRVRRVALSEGLVIFRMAPATMANPLGNVLMPARGCVKIGKDDPAWYGSALPLPVFPLITNEYAEEFTLVDYEPDAALLTLEPARGGGRLGISKVSFVNCEQYESEPLQSDKVVLFPGKYKIAGGKLVVRGAELAEFTVTADKDLRLDTGLIPASTPDLKIRADQAELVITRSP